MVLSSFSPLLACCLALFVFFVSPLPPLAFACASRVALSSATHAETFLTHAESYTPPAPPADILAYASRQLERIESSALLQSAQQNSHQQHQLPHCSACQLLVQTAEWIAQSNSSMGLVEALLDGLCALLRPNSTQRCDAAVRSIVTLAERVPALMKHVGLYEPIRACSFLGECSVSCCADQSTPTQIALGLARNSSQMHVSWVTGGEGDGEGDDTVWWGLSADDLVNSNSGYHLTTTAGGWLGWIHRVVLTDLPENSEVFYSISNDSAVYSFTTLSDSAAGIATPLTIGVVGDMAATDNAWSRANIAFLNGAVQAGQMQAVIHVGDISYADGFMGSWDLFFQELQPTLTAVPYQVIPGNHELFFNFSAYKSRFFTSGLSASPEEDALRLDGLSGTNLWSAYDIGCAHFVALCSEDNFDTAYVGDDQLAWLEADLDRTRKRMESAAESGSVDSAACSTAAPTFLVVYLHRPLYCTDNSTECNGLMPAYLRSRLEGIFVSYGVDLVIYGHMHNYERTEAVYAGQPNSAGPIYIVHGAGGNREGIEDDWVAGAPPVWSALQASVTGVGELTLVNSTAMQWQFFAQQNSTGGSGAVSFEQIDQVWISARDRSEKATRLQREAMLNSSTDRLPRDLTLTE